MSNLVITYSKRRRKRHKNDNSKNEESTKTKVARKVCMFCSSAEDNELEFGKIFEKNGITVHYFCMLLSSGLCQNGTETRGILGFLLQDIKKEIIRGSRLRCCFCREKGATIGCCICSCRKVFHLGCGRQNGSLHQFFGEFKSYCDVHWPKQLLSSLSCSGAKRKSKTTCLICFAKVNTRMFWDIVQSPCCENLFHRKCLQQYALSAGLHYFKCPLCNSTKDFQKHTLQMGIYIPDQDAAWEKEANAFEELLERHSSCNAESCSCYWGRQHDADAGPYELLLCECCGSYGSHRACKALVRSGTLMVCPECSQITDAVEKNRLEAAAIETAPSLTQSSSSLHDRGCRSSNSQTSIPQTSDSAFWKEDIVVMGKEDVDGFVDILSCDNDDDFSLSSHVNSRFVNCKVILERIDLKYNLQSGSVNLKHLRKRKIINNTRKNHKRVCYPKSQTFLHSAGCTSTDTLELAKFSSFRGALSKKRSLGSAFNFKSQKVRIKQLWKYKSLKKKAKCSFVGIPTPASPQNRVSEQMNLVTSLRKSLICSGASKQGETSQVGLSSARGEATALKTGNKNKKKLVSKNQMSKSMFGQKTIDHYFTKVTDKAAGKKGSLTIGESKQHDQVLLETVENKDKNHEPRELEIPTCKTEKILKESFEGNSPSVVQPTALATQASKESSFSSSKTEENSLEKKVPCLLYEGVNKDSVIKDSSHVVSLLTQSLHKAAAAAAQERTMSRSKDVVYVHHFDEFKKQSYYEILPKTDVAAD